MTVRTALILVLPAVLSLAVSQSEAEAQTTSLLHVERTHTGSANGTRLTYRSIVDEMPLQNAAGETIATIVSTSYLRTDVAKDKVRPVLFVFNGGPGSASVWLQMGLIAPKRVAFSDDTKPETVPPFALVDNPDTPLDVADIVLIDPPGTGYSTVTTGHEAEVYGVDEDATAVAQFINTWCARNGRLNAPKYLLGESYGTLRAARLARKLAGGPMETGHMTGLTLNGILLYGQSMNFAETTDVTYLAALPTLAATAWYHGLVDKSATTLDKQIADAKAFAKGDYLQTLFLGDTATKDQKDRVAARIAALTGLSSAYVQSHELRVSPSDYAKEALASKGLQIGLYDGRFTLPLAATGSDPVADDPAMGQYVPGFLAAAADYRRDDLGLETDREYHAIEFRSINARWNYGAGPGVPPNINFATDLAVAMRRNPALRVFVGEGAYDLVTTAGMADYTVSHSGLDAARVTVRLYPSGHMPYMGAESRKATAADIRRFISE
ncbi:MAG: hypothetical protein QM647_18610 [Asticcacaulis sp.]|uniref:S10 family peptidase n=1 Tax=Asticcacaulis sp. TaxID=1872648 RepID=UPI0039E2B855